MPQHKLPTLRIACALLALNCAASAARAQELGLRFKSADQSPTSPCADFYAYACGPWLQAHPIPNDRSAWDPYYQLDEKNTADLRAILEGRVTGRGAEYQKVTNFYAACMNEEAVEKHGLAPLRAELGRIDAIRTPADAVAALAGIQALRTDALFSPYPEQDLDDPEQVLATLDLGWLGLTDRDYYLGDDARSKELRQSYREHVVRMLELSGMDAAKARAGAEAVLKLERAMARARPTREERRDPTAMHHVLTRAQLDALTPGWPWARYFRELKAPEINRVNVASPRELKVAAAAWLAMAPADQQAYLRYHLMTQAAEVLPAKVADEDFRFYRTVLKGVKEKEPRWKRCAKLTNDALGEAVGKIYVEHHFSAEQKQRTLLELRSIQAALREELTTLPWMSDATRKAALRKLDSYRFKVGYPEHWRDYAALDVRSDDAAGNALRAMRFEFARRLRKIGQPVDRDEWYSLPQEVDGYENSSRVEIVFTAGILQPPFLDPAMDDAVNYGAIGRAMGHEFTHGFDDEGRRFDAHGKLRDWWTKDDAAKFEQRAQCLADEYGQFVAVDDKKLNGRLTLGENIADNGGVRLAYAAMQSALADRPRMKIDGLTPEQRFFLAFAKTQCVNVTPETARHRLLTDPHSPGRWRVNGSLRNFAPFAKAFGCKAGDFMVSANPCRVW